MQVNLQEAIAVYSYTLYIQLNEKALFSIFGKKILTFCIFQRDWPNKLIKRQLKSIIINISIVMATRRVLYTQEGRVDGRCEAAKDAQVLNKKYRKDGKLDGRCQYAKRMKQLASSSPNSAYDSEKEEYSEEENFNENENFDKNNYLLKEAKKEIKLIQNSDIQSKIEVKERLKSKTKSKSKSKLKTKENKPNRFLFKMVFCLLILYVIYFSVFGSFSDIEDYFLIIKKELVQLFTKNISNASTPN
ncbi:hypothetical protein TRFO_29681 [Tritrichomonas foetus]|uniref:Uncharacterized protein n=1 Tax=Tritrichomonas foetus TaxID=1144522 RepID=A0A1J4JV54_9EUKA|nr:hypothetical protein TRFO_29681 [Tritrichomonas foetus]|eukprot:OHT03025.1 hypothetical protein TRFO_29681 [Tritrichomonas foetus]